MSQSSGSQTISPRYLVGKVALTYGASVAINAARGFGFVIIADDGNAFTVANPTNPTTGQRITIRIANASGGDLGAVTWDTAYKLGTWVSPDDGYSRSIDFQYDGTNWIEVCRSADVPN
jgi:hypothetical protein